MKKLTFLIPLLFCLSASAQWTGWGLGLLQQPNALAGRFYIGVTNVSAGTNIVMYYNPVTRTTVINATGGGGGGGGGGTVTDFSSGNLTPLFTTSVATSTTTPALSFSLSSQGANTVFSGPTGGGAAAPSFRSLVSSDIPSLTLSKISDAGTVAGINLSGNASELLNGVGGWSTISASGITGITNSGGVHSLISVSNPPTIGLKSLSAGSNITITDQGGTNLSFSASGGGGGISLPGVLSRPVYANQVGDATAAAFWPDMSTYQIDEEFNGGLLTAGSIGTYGWNLFTQSGGSLGSVIADGFGNIRLNTTGTSGSECSLDLRSGGSAQVAQQIGSSSNYQGAVRFRLGATNLQSDISIGFSAGTFSVKTNKLQVFYNFATNGGFYCFLSHSPTSSAVFTSTVPVVINTFVTWRFWSTNYGEVNVSINNETPFILPVSSDLVARSINIMCRTSGNGSGTILDVDRFAIRYEGLSRD